MKKWIKWVMIAAVVIIGGIAFYGAKSGGVSAEVLQAEKGEMRQYLEDTAQVLSREKQTVYIEGAGKIVQINVNVGDAVKQGDLLLSLDKTDLELQLKDAEAKIEASRAQLKGTELINYANKIDMAKVTVDQAKNAYDSAQRNFETARKLYENMALSKEEYEKAQDAYKAAVSALDSANLQLADVKQGAPEYLKNSYKAQLEQAVIYRDTILRNLQKQEVKAESGGVVIEKLVEVNAPAAPSTAAFVIGNVNSLELEADILTDDIGKVQIGNAVEISGKPVGETVLKGKVVKIAPAAKTVLSALGVNQKRVPVTIEIQEEAGLLKPGYTLDIKVITAVKNNVVKVPDTAVFEYKGQSHIFVVADGKALLRAVKKGMESGDSVEIQEGLAEGETILVKPDNNIKEGIKIKPLDQALGGSGKTVQ